MPYPIETSTKELCDAIATSIARHEKYRCWASKGRFGHFWGGLEELLQGIFALLLVGDWDLGGGSHVLNARGASKTWSFEIEDFLYNLCRNGSTSGANETSKFSPTVLIGDIKITSSGTERQKRSQNLAPVLAILSFADFSGIL